MPKIINLSMEEIRTGEHPDLGEDCVLIQITDYDIEPPIPKEKFGKYYQYRFLDVEDSHECKDEWRFSHKQAKEIVEVLETALKEDKNVLVHCYAGVSRSGAIVEFAIELGFEDCKYFRDPNSSVLKMLRNTYRVKKTLEQKDLIKRHTMGKGEILFWRVSVAASLIWCAYFSYLHLHK